MRLIDADQLTDVVNRSYLTQGEKRLFNIKIRHAPTVIERPHGKWIDPQNVGANNWCSVCGKFILHYEGICNYCPNCGADMTSEDLTEENSDD